jgi:[ribosomal protein S5]-alanine N-acetyltransferase
LTNLTGDRIYLREFKFTDWIDVHAYASQEIVSRFQPWGPNNEEQSQAFVKQIIEDSKKAPRTRFVFAIVERSTEKMIGAGEFNIRSYTNKSGKIAYIVHPDIRVKVSLRKLLTYKLISVFMSIIFFEFMQLANLEI